MRKQAGSAFNTISFEGTLFPPDFLHRIVNRDSSLEGLSEPAYHLTNEKLNEAINSSWMRLLQKWHALSRAHPSDQSSSIKEQWFFPLFFELGYGRLSTAKPFEKEGKRYPISHGWGHVPIHFATGQIALDDPSYRIKGSAVHQSPHILLQELLNHFDGPVWGIVTNGLRLRLLRRDRRLMHRTYIEFDLEAMMQEEVYADFVLFWLLCHQSRFEEERPEDCWLERWSRMAHEQGIRALDKLRSGVEGAIKLLGQGFLECRVNQQLRERVRSGALEATDYYRQLLRLVYRIIVLFVAEDRGLLLVPNADEQAKERYLKYYSMTRLRHLARRRYGSPHTDLFKCLIMIMQKLSHDPGCPELALPTLDGFLFEQGAIGDLEHCDIANAYLLEAIRLLAFLPQKGNLMPVDYQHMGSEELGSVYEALLELHAVIEVVKDEPVKFSLQANSGNERKTSGAYYTPRDLVECLLDSALEPVVIEACQQPDPVKALLSLKVCDPACGSGHFLIAAARRIAYRLAFERAGHMEPDKQTWCEALRDVVHDCIYGVDINEMAVELCKVSLCIEAIEPGKPLVFLDYRIRCGDSLIGTTPALLKQGIPNSAFTSLEGDEPQLCQEYRQRNREGRGGQLHLLIEPMDAVIDQFADMQACDDNSYQDVLEIKQRYQETVEIQEYKNNLFIAHTWCAAFFWHKVYINSESLAYPFTHGILQELIENRRTYQDMGEEIERLARDYKFFHWHLEFPDVFHIPQKDERPENEHTGWSGGFDVVLGNPPWERIKLQEQEWFAIRNPDIANAANAASRHRKIDALQYDTDMPDLHAAFIKARGQAERKSHFIRTSGHYPLCGRGDVNTYPIFAEHMRHLLKPKGYMGCIVPSGVATDDTTKTFFQYLMNKNYLVSLYDFENRAKLFSAIDSRMKFCLLTMSGSLRENIVSSDFMFFIHNVADLQDASRHFTLRAEDIALLNPNTKTCPIFRSKRDMVLTKAIYNRIPVLIKDGLPEENSWGISFFSMFHMTNDSHLFRTYKQLEQDGWTLHGNYFFKDGEQCLPLYEGKMIWHFDHRYGTYGDQLQRREEKEKDSEVVNLCHEDPLNISLSRYWIHMSHLSKFLIGKKKVFLAFRDVTNSTNIRTAVFTVIPVLPCGNNLSISLFKSNYKHEVLFLVASNSSFAFDYVARQKLGGSHMNFFILKQLPVIPPGQYTAKCDWILQGSIGDWIFPRALELTYTACDLEPFAKDCGYNGPPFRWNEERRFLLRCELDAAYFHLYGIAHDDVDYIMDTFRVWREKEVKQLGEYRTKRVILEIYDEIQQAMETGIPYQTHLDPPPADPSVSHIVDETRSDALQSIGLPTSRQANQSNTHNTTHPSPAPVHHPHAETCQE